ncbi:MAG: amidohydrolase [Promethearchaeota archaeon]
MNENKLKSRIFYNGSIITMNDSQPFVEAVGIYGEKVIAVGSLDDVQAKVKVNFELIDLKGKTLLPGFIDCHMHAIGAVFFLLYPDFSKVRSLKELLQFLKGHIKDKKPNELILGFKLDEQRFEIPILPTRWDLDKVSPNNPVFIFRHDVHSGIANSKALALAGITNDTLSPEGGGIQRNENGEITGILTENATNLIFSIITLPDSEIIKKAASEFFGSLATKGITSIHGVIELDRKGGVENLGGIAIPILKTIKENILQNYYSIVYTASPKKIKRIKKPPLDEGKRDSKFRVGCIKAWMDGALGASTALMEEPYTDQPKNWGYGVINEDELYERMKTAHNLGFQIAIHAIGDQANRVVMNLYKKLLKEYPKKDHRHRIEHASVLTKDIIKDIKEYGIIASCQPAFIHSDSHWLEKRLGKERCNNTYPFKSIVDAGVNLAAGSDCPVENPDPILGLHCLVTRNGFIPEECLAIEDALKAYTINGAFASFEEDIKGSIEVGKLADLVILDKNPLRIPKDKIREIKVIETIIRGKTVYRRKDN